MQRPVPLWLLLTLFLGLSAGAGPVGCGIKAHADFDLEAPFPSYRSFAFLPLKAPEPGTVGTDPANSQLVARRAQREIERVLIAKGYRLVPKEQADLLVGFEITTREKTELYSQAYRPGRHWGGYDLYSYSYTEGTLVIDLVDAKAEELVWHGWASEPVKSYGDTLNEVSRAVEAILKDFPPDPGGA